MKHHLTTLTISLLLCAQAFAAAADKPNNLIIYSADRFLVVQGLLTGEPTPSAPATGEKYTPASKP